MEKLFNEKKCSECGRVFIVADSGAYRYKKNVGNRLRYFCGWSCMRSYEKKGVKCC